MRWMLAILAVVAFLIRLIALVFLPDQNFGDAKHYLSAGRDLLSDGRMESDFVMPLYPIWAAIWGGGKLLLLADALLSAATVWFIGAISWILFQSFRITFLATFVAAIYPHFIFYSITGLSETVHLFILTGAFLLFYRKLFTAGSFVLVASLLMRPSLEFVAPLLVLFFVMIVHRGTWKEGMRRLVHFVLIYFVLMSPWWLHNYEKYGDFVRLNLGDGIVLYYGNNPANQSGGGIAGIDGNTTAYRVIADPIERNSALKKDAVKFILADPGHFLKMAVVKFNRFWRLWPYASRYQSWYIIVASLLSYGLMLFSTICFLISQGRRYWRLLSSILLLTVYLTFVHMVTIGSIRYRLPLEPFLVILGSAWLARLSIAELIVKKFRNSLPIFGPHRY